MPARTLAGNHSCGEVTQKCHCVDLSPCGIVVSLIKTKVAIILNGTRMTETEHSMAVFLNRNQNERLY
jgi:hypothetical protein